MIPAYESIAIAAQAASEPTLRRELLSQKRGSLLEDIMVNLRSRYEVRVNQELVERFNS